MRQNRLKRGKTNRFRQFFQEQGDNIDYRFSWLSEKLHPARRPAFWAARMTALGGPMKGKSSMKESKGKKKVEKTKTIAAQPSLKGLTPVPPKKGGK